MLGWSNLSRDQRVGGIFMLVILLAGGGAGLVSETVTLKIRLGGLLLVALSILLNPASFKQRLGELIDFQSMPAVCRWLTYVGFTVFVVGWSLEHVFGGFK